MAEQTELRGAREHIDASFDERAIERGLAGLSRRITRRKRIARASGALAIACAACLTFVLLQRDAPALTPNQLRTADGSVATLMQQDSALHVEHERADEVALQLTRGKGHFEVSRNPRRRYRVRAGQVDVQVLGTGFDVERRGPQTFVRVQHGLVRVAWQDGARLLHAGEEGLFPPAQPLAGAQPVPLAPQGADVIAPRADAEDALLEDAEPVEHGAPRTRERWRKLARAGKHKEAFGSLGKSPVVDLEGLLLAADAARLSGHPREAVGFLQRLVDHYPRSAPARLAAFTLGRLALHELNDPALAARSFARAYRFDPDGPLAEDALAREAEAYHRAGDAERAKSAAQRYLGRFPQGARAKELARYAR